MSNHQAGNEPEEADPDTDDVMMIRGKIKWLGLGKILIRDEEFDGFIDCIIETMFGDLEVVITYDQVPEIQRVLLKPGMILTGTFVLSGDAAVKECSNGIVKDERHHLALLRHIFPLRWIGPSSSHLLICS